MRYNMAALWPQVGGGGAGGGVGGLNRARGRHLKSLLYSTFKERKAEKFSDVCM